MTSRFDSDWECQQSARFSAPLSDYGLGHDHVAAARAIYSARRQRDFHFRNSDLFADPAWDMMLALLIDCADGRATSISSACIASYVPATTALRWIDKMVTIGLLSREADPFDRRRSHLNLTREACEKLALALSTKPRLGGSRRVS
ncbi:MarR family transcriptional regulator [Sphingomonas sp. 179-I 2A4 NHS]|uniref:MarR family transcriptional regulator n=1 Tax=unclassified Sphingomonas TaxID=196159 RepID=UPI0038791A1D